MVRLVDANLLLGQVCQTIAQTIVYETQNCDATNGYVVMDNGLKQDDLAELHRARY